MKNLSVKFTHDQQQIIDYLKEQITAGKTYFKSSRIGEALSLSSKTVGTNLTKISQKHKTLKISPYADCGTATTCKIEIMRKLRGS